jgi:hypothetical protein
VSWFICSRQSTLFDNAIGFRLGERVQRRPLAWGLVLYGFHVYFLCIQGISSFRPSSCSRTASYLLLLWSSENPFCSGISSGCVLLSGAGQPEALPRRDQHETRDPNDRHLTLTPLHLYLFLTFYNETILISGL